MRHMFKKVTLGTLGDALPKNIDMDRLSTALIHPSAINEFESDEWPTIDEQKARVQAGKLLLDVITCCVVTSDFGIAKSQQLSDFIILFKTVPDAFYDYYGIGDLIVLSRGEHKSRTSRKYIEIVYALLFAIYESCGFSTAVELLQPFYNLRNANIDYKTKLQEYVFARNGTVEYRVVRDDGPDHDKTFEVELTALHDKLIAKGKSKKKAEIEAAKMFLYKHSVALSVSTGRQSRKRVFLQRTLGDISTSRQQVLYKIRQSLDLTDETLPIPYLDVCLTHKSALNGNAGLESNDLIKSVGAYVTGFVTTQYLFHNFNSMCKGKCDVMMELKSSFVSSQFLQTFVSERWMAGLVQRGLSVNADNSSVLRQDIFQSVIGALFIQSMRVDKYNPFETAEKFITKSAKQHDTGSFFLDYRAFLVQLVDFLGFEWGREEQAEYGPAHERTYALKIRIFNPGISELDFSAEGQGRSIKHAHRSASNSMIRAWMDYVNEIKSSTIHLSEVRKSFLVNLLEFLLRDDLSGKPSQIYLYSLTLQTWSDYEIKVVLDNLYELGLYAQMLGLLEKWSEYNPNVIIDIPQEINCPEVLTVNSTVNDDTNSNAVIVSSNDAERVVTGIGEDSSITSTVRNPNERESKRGSRIVAETSIVTVEGVGNGERRSNPQKVGKSVTRIFTRMYIFSELSCQFCGLHLTDQPRILQVHIGNELVFLETTSLSCAYCGITGLHSSQFDQLKLQGYKIGVYEGSPSYFESTVLKRNLSKIELMRIGNRDDHDKIADTTELNEKGVTRRRVVSPEQLLRNLEVQRETGWSGEQFVFDREKAYFHELGRDDLSERVRWVSKEDTTVGYDIQSFFSDGTPKYIEVKSTRNPYDSSFEISSNELKVARQLGEHYAIYRVFNVSDNGLLKLKKFFNPSELIESGVISLTPTTFRATSSRSSNETDLS